MGIGYRYGRTVPGPLRTLLSISAVALAAACGGGSSSSAGSNGPPPGSSGPGTDPHPASGLDSRPGNSTCKAPPLTAPSGAAVAVERVFPELPFDRPVAMLHDPVDGSRWFVLEKEGRIRVFANDPAADSFDPDFIDLDVDTRGEGGLLGMAFDPEYPTRPEVYLSFTEGPTMVSVVARFTSNDGGITLDPGSREDVIAANQPFTNHNGGHIAFGPDGHLYIGLGDGGSGGDPLGHAQNTETLLGALLRIDVGGGAPYAIPADNPFAGNPLCPADHTSSTDCPEIFAWGLRNPWRFSFDRQSGALWLADVGQSAREEIDVVEHGGNYGWNCREGRIAYSQPGPACASLPSFDEPVHDYPRTEGQSVTGGYVYRGTAIPTLLGQYVFGDFVSGRIWRLVDDGAGGLDADELASTGLSIVSFAEDRNGELYIVDYGGTLHRIVPAAEQPDANASPVSALLSATGCVDPEEPSRFASGVIPYAVSASAWFDGAARERGFALPDGTAIAVDENDRWIFPPGSVLIEHLRLDGSLVETRVLMHHPGGEWRGYSYEWNAERSDARLVSGGKRIEIDDAEWIFPTSGECLACHRNEAGTVLGAETAQLNRPFTYPSTGRTAHQLETLDAIGLFVSPIGDVDVLPALASPDDAGAPLGARARAYLHANCAHCHRGSEIEGLDLRYGTLLEQTGACDAPPLRGDLGIANARIIAPGDADRSVLLARLERRDALAMPPLGSTRVDTEGAALVRAWIESLDRCL